MSGAVMEWINPQAGMMRTPPLTWTEKTAHQPDQGPGGREKGERKGKEDKGREAACNPGAPPKAEHRRLAGVLK